MLNLIVDINIRLQPQDVTVAKGNKVDLSINARGPGRKAFTYQWRKVGNDSLPDTASGKKSAKLIIRSITPSDSGMYYCIVMNQWGTMLQSDNATVNVLCELVASSKCLYSYIISPTSSRVAEPFWLIRF